MESGRLDEAPCMLQRLESSFFPMVGDPDQLADALFMTALLQIGVGRLVGARAMVERLEETVRGPDPTSPGSRARDANAA